MAADGRRMRKHVTGSPLAGRDDVMAEARVTSSGDVAGVRDAPHDL